MDLKKIENKNTLQSKIKDLFNDFADVLLDYTESNENYKKAALLYYWFKDFKNYVKNEENFNSKFLPTYNRGAIVNVNFGFNVGSEFGGLHYAVVLAESAPQNPALVVVPLKSYKPTKEKYNKSDVILGDEVFNQLYGKYTALKNYIPTASHELNTRLLKNAEALNQLKNLKDTMPKENLESFQNLNKMLTEENEKLHKQLLELQKQRDLLDLIWNELLKLKHGSVASVGQIRTVSKMRIKNPINKNDVFYGVKLSANSLQAIDDKIISLFTNKH